MQLYRDDGIVLRTQKLGEADRIITILGRTSGRIRGAPGAPGPSPPWSTPPITPNAPISTSASSGTVITKRSGGAAL